MGGIVSSFVEGLEILVFIIQTSSAVVYPHIIVHIVKLLSSCLYERTPANLKIELRPWRRTHLINFFFFIKRELHSTVAQMR